MKIEFFQPTANKEGAAYVQDAFLQEFRGFTALPAIGSWKAGNGELVQEPVEVLTVFTDKPAFEVAAFLERVVHEFAHKAHQEAVFYVVDGQPHTIFFRAPVTTKIAA